MKKHYICPWCEHEFDRQVSYSPGGPNPNRLGVVKGHKSALSTQVKCPKCLNLIPTWDIKYIDGKKVKVRNG